MDTIVKTNSKELINEATEVMLKRAGLKKKDIYDFALRSWAANNINLLTPSEQKKYKSVIL